MVGQLLKKLDDLGIADNTIVIWTTDNGAEVFSWPDGGTTPFKGEKNTNWEGGYRVPCVMRWPGVIKPGTEINEITSHEDFVPTLVAAAGEPNVKEKLLTGYAGRRQDLQGPSRRLRPARPAGRHRPRQAQGVLLLDRRRQPRRPALRPLEARLHGAARGGSRRLAGPAGPAALPEAVRPARRPVRAGAGGRRRLCHDGASSAPSCSSRPRPTWRSTCRPTSSFRRGRSPAASRSIRCWRSCKASVGRIDHQHCDSAI